MGCCFSSTSTPDTAAAKTKHHNSPLKPPILQSHRTPSPPAEEEEEEAVIKEVLVVSEEPKLHEKKIIQTHQPLPPETQTDVSSTIKEHEQQEQETSHLSQQSEIYTISETMSTTTTATEGLKEDEATSKQRIKVKHKSPAKVMKKSPINGHSGSVRARGLIPQPEKRVRGRGRGIGTVPVRTVQRDVGSRSKSPATGRAGGFGNRTAGRSTATVTGKPENKAVASVTAEGQSKREEDGNKDVVQAQRQQGTESLDNPLVSLECFIFL